LALISKITSKKPGTGTGDNITLTKINLFGVDLDKIINEINLINLTLLVVVFFTLKAVLTFCAAYLVGFYRTILRKEMRLRLLRELRQSDTVNNDKAHTGKTLNLAGQHIDNTANSFNAYMQVLSLSVSVIIYSLFALSISPLVTIFSLIAGAILAFTLRKLHASAKSISTDIASRNYILSEKLSNYLHSESYFVATNQSKQEIQPMEIINKQLFSLYKSLAYQWAFINSIREPYSIFVFVISIYIFTSFIGEEVSSIILCFFLMYRVGNLGIMAQTQLQAFFGNVGSLDQYLSDLRDLKNTARLKKTDNEIKVKIKNVDKISFSNYKNIRQKNITQVIDAVVFKGSILRITGVSGTGKSSILSDLLLLTNAYKGKIFINNIPLNRLDIKHYRDLIGYVSQQVRFPQGGLCENITSGKKFMDLSDDEKKDIKFLIKSLNLQEIADYSIAGFDTEIGNDSVKLSGGQQQRLHIARELFKKPEILILDEPTSSLDKDNSKLVKKLLMQICSNCIIILISHDQSFKLSCDEIINLGQ
ncbi:ABC transporter ATP-binding protein/permease, partial [Amylibacter sp.]|nr:ABC transporter ATP-binding protein/permease [Amylibacter sp.]